MYIYIQRASIVTPSVPYAMALSKALLLLGLVTLARCQQLNGHINPLWLSTGREDLMARNSLQQGHVNSLWLSTRGEDRNPLLQLYYLDSAGTFRPLALQNPSLSYRGTERDYDGGRVSLYNRMTAPYRNTNY